MRNQLEKYLWQIEDQLVMLPSEQRREEVREIRSHLERMIEANIARGCDVEEAVTKAVGQFGSARKVGQELKYSSSSTLRDWKIISVKLLAFDAALIFLNAILFFLLTINGFDPIQSTLFLWVLRCSGVAMFFALGWASKAGAPNQSTTAPLIIIGVIVLGLAALAIVSKGQLMGFTGISPLVAMFAGIVTRCWQIKKRTATSN